MKIERVRINGKSFYFADGTRINSDTLATVIKGLYGKEVCSEMYRGLINDGFVIVEKYIGSGDEQLIAQLECADKKIAALEKKVAQLTLENIYQTPLREDTEMKIVETRNGAPNAEVDKADYAASLARAMKIAMRNYQGYCRARDLTAAARELQLYDICRRAMRDLYKEAA